MGWRRRPAGHAATAERARVAHGERLPLDVVPLDGDPHAVVERVEALAGERVGDVRVLRAQPLEVPRAHRPGVARRHRRHEHFRNLLALHERERVLQRVGNARRVIVVELRHLVLVALAGEGGAGDAGDDLVDAPLELARERADRLGGVAGAQREHLSGQHAERLRHARALPQAREQLVAHRVLEDAPAALVVRPLVVQRVDAVAQLGPGQVSLGDERRLARREAHHWWVSLELDGDGVRADDAQNVVLALRLEPEEAESSSVRRRALRDLTDLQHRGADRQHTRPPSQRARDRTRPVPPLCVRRRVVLEERGVVPKHALDVRARERRAQQPSREL